MSVLPKRGTAQWLPSTYALAPQKGAVATFSHRDMTGDTDTAGNGPHFHSAVLRRHISRAVQTKVCKAHRDTPAGRSGEAPPEAHGSSTAGQQPLHERGQHVCQLVSR